MAQIHFREGSTHYYLPAPARFLMVPVPTWQDHVSMNNSIWRDFTTLAKVRTFSIGWEDLRPSELAVIQDWWDRMILSANALYYVDLLDASEWTLSLDRGSLEFKFGAYTGKRNDATDFEVLYQTNVVFRGTKGETYTLP